MNSILQKIRSGKTAAGQSDAVASAVVTNHTGQSAGDDLHHTGQAPGPPQAQAPPAAPCHTCGSAIFWLDLAGTLRCAGCKPYRVRAIAKQRLLVANDPVDFMDTHWIDYDEARRDADAMRESESVRGQVAAVVAAANAQRPSAASVHV